MGCCHHEMEPHENEERAARLRARAKGENVKYITFLDDDTWADYVDSDTVTVLFFMSGNHLECRRQVPKIIDFSQRFGEKYNVAVIDVAKGPNAAACCGVKDLPTTAIIRQGVFLGGRRGGLDDVTENELLMGLDNIQQLNMEAYLKNSNELAMSPL